jgi:hypothetical protein
MQVWSLRHVAATDEIRQWDSVQPVFSFPHFRDGKASAFWGPMPAVQYWREVRTLPRHCVEISDADFPPIGEVDFKRLERPPVLNVSQIVEPHLSIWPVSHAQ